MKVLIGTTNPSKVRRFAEMLDGSDIEFLTLSDLGITDEPTETGDTPEENARLKSEFYGKYFDRVICNDSGLYFDSLPLDDARQPGLNIRTPAGHERLGEEEMIEYYSALVRSLGGKVLAYYLDGIAVYNCGKVTTFMENSEATRASAFYMVDKPSEKRHPGWPLDSISLNKNTLTYFTDKGDNKYDTTEENIMLGEYRERLISFLKTSLGINSIQSTRARAYNGDSSAQYDIAKYCEEVENDIEQSFFWYRKAALQGNGLAIEKCEELRIELSTPKPSRAELKCRIYPLDYLVNYKFTVICANYQGKWILSKHKKRNTWETQGGHIEAGEDPLECARRELFEESGIKDADIYPVCDYWGFNSQACSNGMVFLAVVHSLGELPESEMKEIGIFDTLPAELTYPQVSPRLYEEAKKLLLTL